MRAVAIIQARLGSTRLPGKVLVEVAGRPVLHHVVVRARAATTLSEVVVATTDSCVDDAVESACTVFGVRCFRGSEADVLDRFYRTARKFDADPIVRITADCPLLDPRVLDDAVRLYGSGSYDYVSNAIRRTFPDGLDVEVFSRAALEAAWGESRLASEREHVTPFLWKQPGRFRLGSLEQAEDLSALRWTVDEPADLFFVRKVYERLPEGSTSMKAVLDVLATCPDLLAINRGIEMNEGYTRSLTQDRFVEPPGDGPEGERP